MVHILDLKTQDAELLQEAIDILRQSGSIDYAQDKARTMLREAWSSLEADLPTGDAKQMLKDLSLYLVDRDL